MGSVVLYLTCFFLSSVMLFRSGVGKNKKNIDGWFIIAILLPIILAAFRYQVGTDFQNYRYMYLRNSKLTFGEWFRTNASLNGNRFIIWVISRFSGIFDSSELFFGIFAFLIVYPVAFVLKKEYSKKITAICYFIYLSTLYASGLNICKQIAAIGVLIGGLKYVYERKFSKYVFVVIVASMIHISAVITIFVYFLYDSQKFMFSLKKILYILGGISLLVMIPEILKLIGGRFGGYLEYKGSSSNRSFYLELVWCVIFLLLYKYYTRYDSRNMLLITMVCIGTILEVTGFYSPFIKRIALYFTCTRFLLIGQLPYVLFKGKSVMIMKNVIYMYFIASFIVGSYILGHGDIIPYQIVGGNGL